MKVAVIGGGAAGFFAAISAKEHHPEATVTLFEKSNKVLAKVKVSGGGRCNVTNGCETNADLLLGYPRGAAALKKAFRQFNNLDTQAWFETRGVKLYTQDDNRVFPVSDDSQTIIDCLMQETKKLGIEIKYSSEIKSLTPIADTFNLEFASGESKTFDKVIVAPGGSPKIKGLAWLEEMGHIVEPPVPSLFTFNMPKETIMSLMGVVCEATVGIQGTKQRASGPVLITHWGMSGPGVLKLSSFGARTLAEADYKFNAQLNWSNTANQEIASTELQEIIAKHPNKQLGNLKPFNIPYRLWEFLLNKCDIKMDRKWGELGRKALNKLTNTLCNDIYAVEGKTTFKEEFVTCGGVSIENIQYKTMESKVVPNLYFAGEVLDIDGITGGYNFQAAWTTGYIAGKLN